MAVPHGHDKTTTVTAALRTSGPTAIALFDGATNGARFCARVYGCFDLRDDDGTLMRIHHALFVICREQAGREASPTAAIIDSHPFDKLRMRAPSSG